MSNQYIETYKAIRFSAIALERSYLSTFVVGNSERSEILQRPFETVSELQVP
jgi:hypothetical protein